MGVVALPAQITPAMSLQIDLQYPEPSALGGVATGAEITRRGFLGQEGAWIFPVLGGDFVTGLTRKREVMGHRLGSGNLRVTCRTRLRHLRRRWIVGIVTVDTRLEGIVQALNDLWKTCRPRRQVFVAGQTRLSPLARNVRALSFVILTVDCRRAVAHLAGQGSVVGPALRLAHVVMTVAADVRSGIPER